jgi:C3HC4-type zinc finger (RING finger) protein
MASLLSHFDLLDRVELCNILFKRRFFNQYYRARSFQMCIRLKPYADQLAELGYYYCGRDIPQVQLEPEESAIYHSFFHLTCVFCGYQHRVSSMQCENGFDFENLKSSHDQHATELLRCGMKFMNIPIKSGLEVNNVHQVETSDGETISMTKLDIQPPLSASELADPKNRFVICLVCRERAIDVAFLPCGCASLCSSCVRNYKTNKCTRCNAEIKGYSKLLIT